MRWPVPVAHCARTSAGTVRATTPGGAFVTVVAKVVLCFDAPNASLVAPQPLVVRDKHDADDPESSVVRPSELAPRLLQPEIVLVRATARQPGKQPAPSRAVVLSVYREQTPLLTKMLHVHGHRDAQRPEVLQPFVEMPIAWARSRFEPSVNPFGVRPHEPRLPNVVAPQHPHAPASFEPLARRTPWRKSLLGGISPAIADGLEPVLPADFNWEYYQCAARDQRFAGVAGGEWIVVDGVSFESPRLQARLPNLSTRARVHHRGASAPAELAMVTDLVIVDAHAMTISLVARGVTPFREGMSITVTAEGAGVPAEWPSQTDSPPSAPSLAYAGTAAADAAPTEETAPLDADANREAANKKAAPFELGARKAARAEAPGAPWAAAPAPVVPAAGSIVASGGSRQTIAITADALQPPSTEALRSRAPATETLGERLARGELVKPATVSAPAAAPGAEAATATTLKVTPRGAPAVNGSLRPARPAARAPLDRSPSAVAERMWKAGVSKPDIDAYLASVKA